MVHYRQKEIPEHPVIAQMERYGEYPYRRRVQWKEESNLHSTGPTTRP